VREAERGNEGIEGNEGNKEKRRSNVAQGVAGGWEGGLPSLAEE